ncbi:MAG: hypothetical protein K2Y37_27405 [Pirellulales bacterium]|nr:hypothetical protein [Pirellulales bacterium]
MRKLFVPLLATLVVLVVFALEGAWPVPDVNEPHYLSKARHFWEPRWLAGDFFLDAPHAGPLQRLRESHLVFFVTCGWWSRWLTLTQVALVGRVLTWLGLAYAWQRLSRALLPSTERTAPVLAGLSAALFVAANNWCQMAGEWMIGGFEAKPVAYIFVLLAVEQLVSGRWTTALAWAGVAAAVHPVVGAWTAVLAAATWVSRPTDRPSPGSLLRGAALAAVLALAGVVPAALMNWSDTVSQANEIYVFRRASHHLLPQAFGAWHMLRFTLLLVFWIAVCWRAQHENEYLEEDAELEEFALEQARLRRLVLCSLLLVGCGILVSWCCWWQPRLLSAILRYYWFRMADVLLPAGAVFAWLGWLLTCLAREHTVTDRRPRLLARASLTLTAVVALAYLVSHGSQAVWADRPRGDGPTKVLDYGDWRAACDWAAANTPRDALFITPKSSQTFKWHAERRELATWKDMPQDAAGIAEWWRRLVDLYGLAAEAENAWTNAWQLESLNERTPEELLELAHKYGASYLLVESELPIELPRCYANKSYAIYELVGRGE